MSGPNICSKIQPPNQGAYHGVFNPDPASGEAERITETSLDNFEKLSGTEVDIALKFLQFSYGLFFPTQEAAAAAKKGGAIFIKLESLDPVKWKKSKKDEYPLRKIIKGEYDYLLERFARGAKAFGKPIFVSFDHEMNGTWYPWSKQPRLYRQAYQHVHQVISKIAPNITWVWNPDIFLAADNYYPGDKFVDWVAIDGYNWVGNASASSIFDKRVAELKAYNKPIMIGEYGCANDNAACLTDFVQYVSQNKEIKAFIYFNKDQEQKWAISTPAEKNAYQRAIRQNEALFRSRIQTANCVGAAADGITPPALRNQIELDLGNRSKWDLSRSKAEENLTLEQLEEVFRLLEKIPPDTLLDPDASQYSAAEFDQLYPQMAAIRKLNPTLYLYLSAEDFAKHWNNTIVLFSVYAQKIIESTEANKNEKIKTALQIAEKFKARLASQQMADLAQDQKRGPSDYNLAIFDLTVAELCSQNKTDDRRSYEGGIEDAIKAINRFLAVEKRALPPSKPDYFLIAKGLLVMGDLYQQLARTSNEEFMMTFYNDSAAKLYSSVAELDAAKGIGLELEANSLFAYLNEAISGFQLKISPKKIEQDLNFNVEMDHITSAEKKVAQRGLYDYLKGTALIKRAGLFAAWPKLKKMAACLEALDQAMLGLKHIEQYNQYLIKNQGKDPKIITEKSKFFFTLSHLIQGELLLGIADRIKYYANDSEEWDEIVIAAKKFSSNANGHPFTGLIAGIPRSSTYKQKEELADNLIRLARDQYFKKHEVSTYPYLYAWSKVKQFEIEMRLANYIKKVDASGRIRTDDPKKYIKVADIEELLANIDAVYPRLDKDDFLCIALEYLKLSLILSGIPRRRNRNQFIIENWADRKVKKISQPYEAIKLIENLKAKLGKLPELNQKYFSILIRIKETQAKIQSARNTYQRKQAAAKTLKALQAIEQEIGYRVPTHIYLQIQTLPGLISLRNIDEAKKVLAAFPKILEENSLHSNKIASLTAAVKQELRRRNYSQAAAKAKALMSEIETLNNQETFSDTAETLVWDMHSLKAELYHQIAVNYAILEKKINFEYAISAYLEAGNSTSKYDREMRILDIQADTGLTDKDIRDFKKIYGEVE